MSRSILWFSVDRWPVAQLILFERWAAFFGFLARSRSRLFLRARASCAGDMPRIVGGNANTRNQSTIRVFCLRADGTVFTRQILAGTPRDGLSDSELQQHEL